MQFKRIFDYVFYWADKLPNHTALIYDDKRITYTELRDNSLYFASFLIELGVRPGDTVAYMLFGCPEFFYMYLACSMLGVSITGINVRSPKAEILRIINVASPKFVIYDDSLRLNQDIFPAGFIPISRIEYNSKNIASVEDNIAKISENNVVFIIFTSGTTGEPKGALLTHKSILSSAFAQIREFGAPIGLQESDIIQHHVPVNHVSGAVQWGVTPLLSGSTIIINREFSAQTVLTNTGKYNATILTGVPAMWNMFFNLSNFKEFDLSSVRWCAIGAAPSNEATIKRILDICDVCSNPLGMTETSGFCSYFGGKSKIDDIVYTVGRIIPELKYKIVDNDYNEVKQGAVGQLAYKGNPVIERYTATSLPITGDGYFLSGDLAFEDPNKKIHLCGRKDDMFTVGGFNVYPAEIEKIIMKYPHIDKVVVLPIPHSTMGNVCRAYIVPGSGYEIDVKQLIDFVSNNLIYYKVPRDIRICRSLPTSSLGKINRTYLLKELKAEYDK